MLELQGIVNGVVLAGIYMLVAVGLTLTFGTMRLANFAHGDIFMLAMYLVYFAVVSWGFELYLTLPIAIPILFAAGFIGYFLVVHPVIKAPPEGMLLTMFGASLIMQNGALIAFSGRVRSVEDPFGLGAFHLGDVTVGHAQIVAASCSFFVVLAVVLILYRTEIGRAIRATSEDRDAAQLAGININRVFAFSFGIGTACLGAAAPLVMPFLSVNPGIGLNFTLIGFLIIVMGGLGSFRGALLAALLVGLADGLGGVLLQGAHARALIFGMFVLVLLFKPTGLFGEEAL